ncbi:MAG: Flp family type IVb pilin [Gemmatimonadota bacterium]
MLDLLKAFWTDESGQDLVEYAMLLALIALIVIGAVALLGQGIEDTFANITKALPLGGGGGGGGGS